MSTPFQPIQGQSAVRTREQILSELQEAVQRLAGNVAEMSDLNNRHAAKKVEVKRDSKVVMRLTAELSRQQRQPKKAKQPRSKAKAA